MGVREKAKVGLRCSQKIEPVKKSRGNTIKFFADS